MKIIAKKDKVKENDKPINVRLEEDFEVTDASTLEKRLDNNRFGEKEVLLEKLLDAKRTPNKESVTEKLLNDTKGSYGNKIRNPEASKGDFNILDQERVAKKKASQHVEKAETASEVIKEKRWWEVKSEDGLKIAEVQNKKIKPEKPEKPEKQVKKAQAEYSLGDIDDIGFDDVDDWDSSVYEDNYLGDEDDLSLEDEYSESNVYLINSKEGEYVFGVIDDTEDEDKTKQDVLDRMLELGLSVEMSDISPFTVNPKTKETILTVTPPQDDFSIDGLEDVEEEEIFSFRKVSLQKMDAGGTPMIAGQFSYSGFEGSDPDVVARDASDYLNDEYDINVRPDQIIVSPERNMIQFAIEENTFISSNTKNRKNIKESKKKL